MVKGRKGRGIMKSVIHFICENCGAEYADKKKAAACEKTHLEPKEIVKCGYLPVTIDSSGYPQTIDVKMPDGTVRRYKRLRR